MSADSPASAMDKFLGYCSLSGLLDFERVAEAYQAFHNERPAHSTVEDFCDFLVRQQILTTWQCDKLRNGRWKGFFLDHFKLLEFVSVGETTSKYVAEDLRTNRRVVLVITPPAFNNGKIKYEVEPL
jgi:eukaryotic-like serine/threonine-protein kinase